MGAFTEEEATRMHRSFSLPKNGQTGQRATATSEVLGRLVARFGLGKGLPTSHPI